MGEWEEGKMDANDYGGQLSLWLRATELHWQGESRTVRIALMRAKETMVLISTPAREIEERMESWMLPRATIDTILDGMDETCRASNFLMAGRDLRPLDNCSGLGE